MTASLRVRHSRKACPLALVLVCLVALFAPTAYASEQRMRFGTLDAFVWTPDDRSPTPWPVVVFSHGVYMCGNQSRFFTEALAAAGYLVIAPNHTDASCRPFDADAFNPSRSPLKPASMWTDADYRDRANDVRSALDALSNDPRLSGQADRTRVALAGHSLGGYTVLGLGGAWPAWRLPRLKAILAMAPYSLPYASSRGLHELDAPVMYQAGSFDPVFTSPLHGSDGAYERSPPPKYYVEFAATSHAGWLDPAGPAGKKSSSMRLRSSTAMSRACLKVPCCGRGNPAWSSSDATCRPTQTTSQQKVCATIETAAPLRSSVPVPARSMN